MLISARELTKSFAGKTLFKNVQLGIDEKQKIGLVGPNGAGKSTLLKILTKNMKPDSGEVIYRKGISFGFLPQTPEFKPDTNILDAILEKSVNYYEDMAKGYEWFSKLELAQFGEDFKVSSLSGGWQKRVALARELICEPDVLFLDEPTNHLDIESILWLEEFIQNAPFATVTITHDRLFLQRVSNRIFDLDPRNPGNLLVIEGDYIKYLEAKELLIHSLQQKEKTLTNTMRRETEWLRRGPQARLTKQKARIERAHDLIDTVGDLKRSNYQRKITIDFKETDSTPKKLIEIKNVTKAFNGKTLFSNYTYIISPKTRLALLGKNGCGKSTFIKTILGMYKPDPDTSGQVGEVILADKIKVAYFEQNRETLDFNKSVLKNICPEGDYVSFQGEYVFNRSYLERFLFQRDQMDLPVSQLSGGEQARLRIAQMMLTEASVLVLDEPTNDLDVATLTVLEEALVNFKGAVILVTHDRYFMDQVATDILAFAPEDSDDKTLIQFSEYYQWEVWFDEYQANKSSTQNKSSSIKTKDANSKNASTVTATMAVPANTTISTTTNNSNSTVSATTNDSNKINTNSNLKKLSQKEKFEFEKMEGKIAKLEEEMTKLQGELDLPETVVNSSKLMELTSKIAQVQTDLDQHYTRWAELEARSKV